MGKVVYNPSRSDYGFTNENFTVDLDGNIYATSITLAENEDEINFDFTVTNNTESLFIDSYSGTFPTITVSKNKNFYFRLLLQDDNFYIFDSTQLALYAKNIKHSSGDRNLDAQGKETGFLTLNVPNTSTDTVLYYTNSSNETFGQINIINEISTFHDITITGDDEATVLNTGNLKVNSGASISGNLVLGKDLFLSNNNSLLSVNGDLTLSVDSLLSVQVNSNTIGVIDTDGITIPSHDTNINNVTIDNSTINNSVIGSITPNVGTFSELSVLNITPEASSVTNKKYVDNKVIALAIAFGI